MVGPVSDLPAAPLPGLPIRTYLKKVFLPNPGVGSGSQILGIPAYACGLKPGPAYTLDQNPFFEIGSNMPLPKIHAPWKRVLHYPRWMESLRLIFPLKTEPVTDGNKILIYG